LRIGDGLRSGLAQSGVDARLERRIWSVLADDTHFRVDALAPGGPEIYRARAVIAATGTSERIVPFPGWTLPGVVGLAAATILLKSQRILPGRRSIVAGTGPLLMLVAAAILKAGGAVAAVVDLAGRREWLHALPAMMERPDLLARGLGWRLALQGKRIPILHRHTVLRAEGRDVLERVIVCPVDGSGQPIPEAGTRTFEVDALTVGHGLIPAIEISRLLRAEHRFDRLRGGWTAEADHEGRTSVSGLYVAGDGAGLRGAAAAGAQGDLAALAVAGDLGVLSDRDHARLAGPLHREERRAARFGGAMARLTTPRPAQVAAIPAETIVCRCEDVTRSEIDGAIEVGAGDINQLKHFTRCGMGPCQGRMCGETVAELLALRLGSRAAVGMWTARTPIRPLPLDAVLGQFEYADIPVPPPAPL
jgi:thioredoxin reductase/bacterioferritin-associated ferredoxin